MLRLTAQRPLAALSPTLLAQRWIWPKTPVQQPLTLRKTRAVLPLMAQKRSAAPLPILLAQQLILPKMLAAPLSMASPPLALQSLAVPLLLAAQLLAQQAPARIRPSA